MINVISLGCRFDRYRFSLTCFSNIKWWKKAIFWKSGFWETFISISIIFFCHLSSFWISWFWQCFSRRAVYYSSLRLFFLIILFYFIVKLLNPFLHSKVLSKPNEKINEEEDDDIACYSQKAMRHPVHTISDRQHCYGNDKAVNYRLLQKAPVFNFPDNRCSSERGSVN